MTSHSYADRELKSLEGLIAKQKARMQELDIESEKLHTLLKSHDSPKFQLSKEEEISSFQPNINLGPSSIDGEFETERQRQLRLRRSMMTNNELGKNTFSVQNGLFANRPSTSQKKREQQIACRKMLDEQLKTQHSPYNCTESSSQQINNISSHPYMGHKTSFPSRQSLSPNRQTPLSPSNPYYMSSNLRSSKDSSKNYADELKQQIMEREHAKKQARISELEYERLLLQTNQSQRPNKITGYRGNENQKAGLDIFGNVKLGGGGEPRKSHQFSSPNKSPNRSSVQTLHHDFREWNIPEDNINQNTEIPEIQNISQNEIHYTQNGQNEEENQYMLDIKPKSQQIQPIFSPSKSQDKFTPLKSPFYDVQFEPSALPARSDPLRASIERAVRTSMDKIPSYSPQDDDVPNPIKSMPKESFNSVEDKRNKEAMTREMLRLQMEEQKKEKEKRLMKEQEEERLLEEKIAKEQLELQRKYSQELQMEQDSSARPAAGVIGVHLPKSQKKTLSPPKIYPTNLNQTNPNTDQQLSTIPLQQNSQMGNTPQPQAQPQYQPQAQPQYQPQYQPQSQPQYQPQSQPLNSQFQQPPQYLQVQPQFLHTQVQPQTQNADLLELERLRTERERLVATVQLQQIELSRLQIEAKNSREGSWHRHNSEDVFSRPTHKDNQLYEDKLYEVREPHIRKRYNQIEQSLDADTHFLSVNDQYPSQYVSETRRQFNPSLKQSLQSKSSWIDTNDDWLNQLAVISDEDEEVFPTTQNNRWRDELTSLFHLEQDSTNEKPYPNYLKSSLPSHEYFLPYETEQNQPQDSNQIIRDNTDLSSKSISNSQELHHTRPNNQSQLYLQSDKYDNQLYTLQDSTHNLKQSSKFVEVSSNIITSNLPSSSLHSKLPSDDVNLSISSSSLHSDNNNNIITSNFYSDNNVITSSNLPADVYSSDVAISNDNTTNPTNASDVPIPISHTTSVPIHDTSPYIEKSDILQQDVKHLPIIDNDDSNNNIITLNHTQTESSPSQKVESRLGSNSPFNLISAVKQPDHESHDKVEMLAGNSDFSRTGDDYDDDFEIVGD